MALKVSGPTSPLNDSPRWPHQCLVWITLMSDQAQDRASNESFCSKEKIMTLHMAPGVVCIRGLEYSKKKGWIQNCVHVFFGESVVVKSRCRCHFLLFQSSFFLRFVFCFLTSPWFLNIASADNDCVLSEATTEAAWQLWEPETWSRRPLFALHPC